MSDMHTGLRAILDKPLATEIYRAGFCSIEGSTALEAELADYVSVEFHHYPYGLYKEQFVPTARVTLGAYGGSVRINRYAHATNGETRQEIKARALLDAALEAMRRGWLDEPAMSPRDADA